MSRSTSDTRSDLTTNPKSFRGLRPASSSASVKAKSTSIKRDTRCEIALRSALWRLGLRYRLNVREMVGCPDIAFPAKKIAIFCDGDFWHGRNLAMRTRKLRQGHNADYWIAKIHRNVARDRAQNTKLESDGWLVLRYWETDILRSPAAIAALIANEFRRR
jgi:DNA mismatch endonuclease, patch repair protein